MLTGLAWQATGPRGTFLNRHVVHGTTLYVDFDAPGDGRTVRHWLDEHKRAFGDGDTGKIIVLEPDLDTYGLAETELVELTEIAKETEAKLILIDSSSSAFPGVDPIKLVQVQGPLWYLRRLAMETGAAVVIIDHLPQPISGERAGARGIIGSVAKSARARAVHILSRVPPKEVQGRNRAYARRLSQGFYDLVTVVSKVDFFLFSSRTSPTLLQEPRQGRQGHRLENDFACEIVSHA